MSAIPPNWLGSILQTHGAQDRAAQIQRKQAADQAARARRESFTDRLSEIIASEDRDTQVYADAEGAGSQGRADQQSQDLPDSDTPQPPQDGDPPAPRLDVQA